MVGGDASKFFYRNLSIGFNIFLMLKLVIETRNIITLILIITNIDSTALDYVYIVYTAYKIQTIILAFLGSIRNFSYLIKPFILIQIISFMWEFGIGIRKSILHSRESYSIMFSYIVDYYTAKCGHYLGLMLILSYRYRDIETIRGNQFLMQ